MIVTKARGARESIKFIHFLLNDFYPTLRAFSFPFHEPIHPMRRLFDEK
jgi:hypothetical protein